MRGCACDSIEGVAWWMRCCDSEGSERLRELVLLPNNSMGGERWKVISGEHFF